MVAVAWIEVGGHWGRTQFLLTTLPELGYEVEHWNAGWTDAGTGRLASVLDITGGGRVKRALSTDRWPDRGEPDS